MDGQQGAGAGKSRPNGQHEDKPELAPGKSKGKAGIVLTFELDKYKPEDWVVPASDTKGHSVRYYFRCPEGYLRQMNLIIASKRFPLKTPGEVIRLGMKLLFEAVKGLEPVPSVISQVQAVQEMVKEEEYNQAFIDTISAVQNMVQRQVSTGEEDRARLTLAKMQNKFLEMNRNTETARYWRRKYLRELETRWPNLVYRLPESAYEAEAESEAGRPVEVFRLRIEREVKE